MLLVTNRPWDLTHTETGQEREYPAGEYPAELRRIHLPGRGVRRWLCLVDGPWGAPLWFWLQWAPGQIRDYNCATGPAGSLIDWREFEVRVYDDQHRLLDEHGKPVPTPASMAR